MKTATPIKEAKFVGVWIRVSTEDQANGDSPQIHEQRARAYAEMKGWTIKEVYHLEGVSGKKVSDHPEAKRMLQDIRRGHITGLVFSKLARLARNVRELLDFSDIFRECNADLISLQESIDTSTPAGRLFYTMIAAMSQWEREEIVDRVKVSVLARAKAGMPLNNSAPYGYHWKDKKLVIHSEEAPVRKLAYELFAQLRRKGAVARALNEKGYRTRNGLLWRDVTIGRILQCPSAKGVHRAHFTKQKGSKWSWEERPLHEQVHIPVEPIVSEELWNQCNQITEEQQKKIKRPGPTPVNTFAGLTFCHCGKKMYVPSAVQKYVCHRPGCGNRIPVADLEAIFYEELKAFFLAPERIEKHLKTASETVNEKQQLLAVQKKEIEKVREEMAKTHKLYLAGQIPVEGFSGFYNPLQERLSQLQSELPKLEAEVAHLTVNHLSADEVMNEARTLYAQWPNLEVEAKRKIVEGITEKITIGKDNEIEITLSYLPTSEVMTKNQQSLRVTVAIDASRAPGR